MTRLRHVVGAQIVSTYRKLFPWMPFEATDPGSAPAPVVSCTRP